MSERSFVPHEYGDDELEVFECGHERGHSNKPCPRDPRFPEFEDYTLHFFQGEDGEWTCLAKGNTRFAQQVSVKSGIGLSREEAEIWVRQSHVAAKDGFASAEKYVCQRLEILPSLSQQSVLALAIQRCHR